MSSGRGQESWILGRVSRTKGEEGGKENLDLVTVKSHSLFPVA